MAPGTPIIPFFCVSAFGKMRLRIFYIRQNICGEGLPKYRERSLNKSTPGGFKNISLNTVHNKSLCYPCMMTCEPQFFKID